MVKPTPSKADQDALRGRYVKQSEDDFLLFVNGLTIPSATGPKLFSMCMVDFQREFFEDIAESVHALRDGAMPPRRRFWLERTKKASKDADLAIIITWLMAFPGRPFKVQVVACDVEQANIVADRVIELMHYNPWLGEHMEVIRRVIRNVKMKDRVWTKIESSDLRGGAHGQTPDLLILNELTHSSTVWKSMEDHRNNADGVPRGMVIISTNAGFKGTKAEVWRTIALESPRWRMHIWHERAPWVSEADVEEAKKRNDPSEFARLWDGRWISGRGGALTEEDIDGCFREGLQQLTEPEPRWLYAAAYDLGVSHDHSGVVVVGANAEESRIRVAWLKDFPPSIPGGGGKLEVDSDAVENACLWIFETFRVGWFGYDPAAGGSFLAQRLVKRGLPMSEMTFANPANLKLMARCFVQAAKERKLECFEDEGLRRDMGKFDIVALEPSGSKLKAVSDEYGHADVGTALVIVLPHAMGLLGYASSADHVYSTDDDSPLTEEELKDMPPELLEIYEEEHDELPRGRSDRWDEL